MQLDVQCCPALHVQLVQVQHHRRVPSTPSLPLSPVTAKEDHSLSIFLVDLCQLFPSISLFNPSPPDLSSESNSPTSTIFPLLNTSTRSHARRTDFLCVMNNIEEMLLSLLSSRTRRRWRKSCSVGPSSALDASSIRWSMRKKSIKSFQELEVGFNDITYPRQGCGAS